MFGWFKKKEKRYYREFLYQSGWGVMLGYDTVWATSVSDAKSVRPAGAYCKSFECIELVKDEHMEMSDYELSKIYGKQE